MKRIPPNNKGKTTKKRSYKAQKVARDLSESIAKGKKISESSLKQIILDNGYSKETAENPQIVLKTKSFQEVMIPAIAKMEAIQQHALDDIMQRDFSGEPLASVAGLIKILNHDIRLFKGESTANIAMNVNLTNLFEQSQQ